MTLILCAINSYTAIIWHIGWDICSKVIFQEKPIGSLRVDDSYPDSGPYLFLELDPDGADAIYKQRYVRLRVELRNYIFRTNSTSSYGENPITKLKGENEMEEKTIDELLNEEIADEIKALSELEAGSNEKSAAIE